MPTTQALSNAQVVESYNTFAAASYIQLAGVALVLYDYVITFNDEVALFWTRGFTGASLLFFIVRYSAVFNYAALDFAIAYGLRLSGTLRLIHQSVDCVSDMPIYSVGRLLSHACVCAERDALASHRCCVCVLYRSDRSQPCFIRV
ncbi:hypothetical protein C8Q78DRAFT_58461 [Trametes maxima]|nr:hypothetical protein C8Q78DRAFT_58461 [Trametes maxima]